MSGEFYPDQSAGDYLARLNSLAALAEGRQWLGPNAVPIFATTGKALSKGVISTASLVGGSGGTNGTFDIGFSGGAGSGAAGRFVVAGGALTSIVLTAAGDSYTSAPTMSFAASSGLSGASAVAVIGNNVDSNEYFAIPSSTADDSLILYQNVAGVATEIKRYPSAAAYTTFADGNIFVVIDDLLNVGFKVDGAGGLHTALVSILGALGISAAGELTTAAFSQIVYDQYLFAIADDQLNVVFAIDTGGYSVTKGPPLTYPRGNFAHEINYFPCFGQSLAVGQATPVQTIAQSFDNLMFVRGMRPQYDYPGESAPVWYGSLVPLVEALSPVNSALAETPVGGATDMIRSMILSENGLAYTDHHYQLLGAAPGYGATTIAQLSKGTAHYARLIDQVTYGLALANTAGKTFGVPAVTWVQGESDYLSSTTRSAYYTALRQLIADLNTDIKALTGQTQDIHLICYQIASHVAGGFTTPTIALAQTDAAEDDPLIHVANAMYQFDYADNFHLTGIASRWLGAYLGLGYKRVVIDGLTTWKPLQPIAAVRQSQCATITFNVPSGHLVLDTVGVVAATNSGFAVVDSGGSAQTITAVEIIDTDRVKITCSATIPAGSKVRYAWAGTSASGRTAGPRGNLRDTQGGSLVFDPSGINKPMHNWCVIFELDL